MHMCICTNLYISSYNRSRAKFNIIWGVHWFSVIILGMKSKTAMRDVTIEIRTMLQRNEKLEFLSSPSKNSSFQFLFTFIGSGRPKVEGGQAPSSMLTTPQPQPHATPSAALPYPTLPAHQSCSVDSTMWYSVYISEYYRGRRHKYREGVTYHWPVPGHNEDSCIIVW